VSRIVTVYSAERLNPRMTEMAFIRWHRMSAALARRGHTVDLASDDIRSLFGPRMGDGFRIVPLRKVRWDDYDVVKTLFHTGFELLERRGGGAHPFIIAKLGSVVGPRDMDGVFFYGSARERMYRVQERIHDRARYVTLLTEPAVRLWRDCYTGGAEVLLVPGAVDAVIPPPRHNPYPRSDSAACLFSGNFYTRRSSSQAEAHRVIAGKLNRLGRLLGDRGVRLHVVGPGDRRSLEPRHLDYHGAVSYHESWDYLHHAAVGVVVAAGPFMHNNESTKIYHYLRAGLPVVSEAGFPNDDVVRESGLGYVVENGALERMADCVAEAARRHWHRAAAVDYVLRAHTWDVRAGVYDRLLRVAGATPNPAAAG
jgi:hypothetical protein